MSQFVYHITHVNNLPEIVRHDGLLCDNERIRLGLNNTEIGYEHIKIRRRHRQVPVAAKGVLADYVPFYFCPRSPMLYAIEKRLTNVYQNGQASIVHLEFDMLALMNLRQAWCFTDRHADLAIAEYFDDWARKECLRWDVILSDDWGGDARRPFKQAEFLVYRRVPWSCVARIGVINEGVATQARRAVESARHQPSIEIQSSWYYR